MKTQAKQSISFANEGREIAVAEQDRQHSQLEQARSIAARIKGQLLSMDPDEAKRQLRNDIAAGFAALDPATAEKRKASINVTATRWAAVIFAIATGFVWAKGAANIQHAYAQISTKRASKRTYTAKSFKGDAADARDHMGKLSAPERGAYAHDMLASVAAALKDGTVANGAIAAAVEYALLNPEAVLQLARADKTLKEGRRAKAA